MFADGTYLSKKSIIRANQRKIDLKKSQLQDLQFQINGLTKEKGATTNQDKLDIIDSALRIHTDNKAILEKQLDELQFTPDNTKIIPVRNQITNLQSQIDALNTEMTSANSERKKAIEIELNQLSANIKSLEEDINRLRTEPDIGIDMGLIGSYLGTVKTLKRSAESRTWSITTFYTESFNKIGRTNQLYLAVWRNYMNKQSNQAPSMVFLQLNKILEIILEDEKNIQKYKSDLKTIESFLTIVKNSAAGPIFIVV